MIVTLAILSITLHTIAYSENSDSFVSPAIPPSTIAPPYSEIVDFSKWDIPLQKLEITASEYRADALKDHAKAYELLRCVKDVLLKDPIVKVLESVQPKTYEYNRSGKDLPGVELAASDVQVDGQRFILAGLPKDLETAAQYWNVILKQQCLLVVSVLDSSEEPDQCNNFWRQHNLEQMTLLNGWTISEKDRELIIEGKKQERGTPAIIKTTLLATNGKLERTITHLQYTGWFNYTPFPDEAVFQVLLNHMLVISPTKSIPIAINCHGGIGRTGATAAVFVLERQIATAVAENRENRYRVNLANIIYMLRRQRQGVLGNPGNVSKIYSVLAKYHKDLLASTYQKATSSP